MNIGAAPVYVAAYKGRTSVVEALIAGGAARRQPGEERRCDACVHCGARGAHGRVHRACRGCDVNLGNNDGRTPVYVAAAAGHTAVVGALIAARCDLNLAMKSGFRPLDIAACANDIETLRVLLLHKADPSERALSVATEHGYGEAVELLTTAARPKCVHMKALLDLKTAGREAAGSGRLSALFSAQRPTERLRFHVD